MLTQAIIGPMKAPLYTSERTLLIRFLLENGADPNRVSPPHSKGPGVYLQNACGHASLEVVELLLQHGAQIRQSGAMDEAGEKGRIDVLVMLLEHGADINEQLWENHSTYSSKYRAKLKKKSGLVIDIGDSAGRHLECVGSGTEQT
jgi:ankyrin repeat protein